MDELRGELQGVFRDVFDDDELVLRDDMTAADVLGWDSLMHVNLIIAVENHFSVRFAIAEVAGLKMDGQNVGSFLTLLASKLDERWGR